MESLLRFVAQDRYFMDVMKGLHQGMLEQLITGLTGSARVLYLAALYRFSKRPIVLITHNANSAQKAYEDICEILPANEVLLYPAHAWNIAELIQEEKTTLGERLNVLTRLANGFQGVLILPFLVMRKFFLSKHTLLSAYKVISLNQTVELQDIKAYLLDVGYKMVNRVEQKGEFGIRGGILDIYPPSNDKPFRLEWDENNVSSIRCFNPVDQLSISKQTQLMISPAKEYFANSHQCKASSQVIKDILEKYMENRKDSKQSIVHQESVYKDISLLENGTMPDGIYKYISVIYPDVTSILSYISSQALFVVDEPARTYEISRQMELEETEWKTLPIPLSRKVHNPWGLDKHQCIYFSLFMRKVSFMQPNQIVQMTCRSMQQFHSQMNVFKAEWERWINAKYHIMIVASSQERMNRLISVLNEYGILVDGSNKQVVFKTGNLSSGFELSFLRLVILTESEIFTKQQRKARRRPHSDDHAEKIKDYQELKPGDYVVHINHGIGRYAGIETLRVGGLHKDYLHVQYSGNDKLYVPVEQIDQVQKYAGSEDQKPKVYSLGSAEWSRVKNKVRSSVKDIAKDLICLYAERQEARGHSFSTDTSMQSEFEALFPYEETPDQLRSIEEIKRDMEKVQPMDRLLCGDVGYGKTEVAIRAAFKAVMDCKQVVVLVPTTILAQQHYETFKERFSGYPINLAVLSRFGSRKGQKDTILGLANGTVDIVIGTHRLLSKDVVYKKLSLLIIDEEQRFGVKHKERIKQLQCSVDVLTLSATPIPRTLHMAMMGARDLSIIETPPENRFPVQTYVLEYSDTLVREAIERELGRNGQVYFLYNRVETIDKMADQLRNLVSEARVAVAHGRMAEVELEQTMIDFLNNKYDILVSTSIIETGVDIPNVNTLIIHSADLMGLSQLYQLRGRVGRSNRIAYAYFTYQPDKILTEIAEKRLQAIKEFTELGSGFKIAMRDLSIRGAGNLLGAEQHGHIASVGFELYSQMLKDAVSELRGQKSEEIKIEIIEPQIQLAIDAYLPPTYINDERQKIECYQRIRATSSIKEIDDVSEEWQDRFGMFPEPVDSLIRIAKLRVGSMLYGIHSIEQKNKEVTIQLTEAWHNNHNRNSLLIISNSLSGTIRITPTRRISIIFRKQLSPLDWLTKLEFFVVKLKEAYFKNKPKTSNKDISGKKKIEI